MWRQAGRWFARQEPERKTAHGGTHRPSARATGDWDRELPRRVRQSRPVLRTTGLRSWDDRLRRRSEFGWMPERPGTRTACAISLIETVVRVNRRKNDFPSDRRWRTMMRLDCRSDLARPPRTSSAMHSKRPHRAPTSGPLGATGPEKSDRRVRNTGRSGEEIRRRRSSIRREHKSSRTFDASSACAFIQDRFDCKNFFDEFVANCVRSTSSRGKRR